MVIIEILLILKYVSCTTVEMSNLRTNVTVTSQTSFFIYCDPSGQQTALSNLYGSLRRMVHLPKINPAGGQMGGSSMPPAPVQELRNSMVRQDQRPKVAAPQLKLPAINLMDRHKNKKPTAALQHIQQQTDSAQPIDACRQLSSEDTLPKIRPVDTGCLLTTNEIGAFCVADYPACARREIICAASHHQGHSNTVSKTQKKYKNKRNRREMFQ